MYMIQKGPLHLYVAFNIQLKCNGASMKSNFFRKGTLLCFQKKSSSFHYVYRYFQCEEYVRKTFELGWFSVYNDFFCSYLTGKKTPITPKSTHFKNEQKEEIHTLLKNVS